MAKNVTTKDLDKAIELRLAGQPWKNVLPQTGLSHSQAERHEFRFKMWLFANDPKLVSGDWSPIPVSGLEEAAIGKLAREHRAKGTSWGVIGERMGLPESRVRRYFAEATSVQSKGQRIGKGGRFAYDDGELYTPGQNHIIGVAIPKGMTAKPSVTKEGAVAGLKPEARQATQSWTSDLMDRRAKRLEAIKAKATPAKPKAEAKKVEATK